jgi:hypothetical protein
MPASMAGAMSTERSMRHAGTPIEAASEKIDEGIDEIHNQRYVRSPAMRTTIWH